GDHRLPAGGARPPAFALDAAAGPGRPAAPAQAQAHLLPGGDHPGGAAAAHAPFLGAAGMVRHRQAGVPLRDPSPAQVGGQRGPGAEAVAAACRWPVRPSRYPRVHPSIPGIPTMTTLSGKTLFITGASRGIGRAIALRAARDGANVVIAAKSSVPNPKLPGTIHTVAEEVEQAGGRALAIQCDIRDEEQVREAVGQAVSTLGGLDALRNSASAPWLRGALDTPMKRYDLMQEVNARGTFLCSQACLPHLLKAGNPHILTLCPPPSLEPKWWGPHTGYTLAKMGMSFVTIGLAAAFAGKVAI